MFSHSFFTGRSQKHSLRLQPRRQSKSNNSHSSNGCSQQHSSRLQPRRQSKLNNLRLRQKSKIEEISGYPNDCNASACIEENLNSSYSSNVEGDRILRVRPIKLFNKLNNSLPESDNDSSPNYTSENDGKSSNYASSDSDDDIAVWEDEVNEEGEPLEKSKRRRKKLREVWRAGSLASLREREERMSLVSALADCRSVVLCQYYY